MEKILVTGIPQVCSTGSVSFQQIPQNKNRLAHLNLNAFGGVSPHEQALLFSGFVGLLVLQRFWELKRASKTSKFCWKVVVEEFSETLSSDGCFA